MHSRFDISFSSILERNACWFYISWFVPSHSHCVWLPFYLHGCFHPAGFNILRSVTHRGKTRYSSAKLMIFQRKQWWDQMPPQITEGGLTLPDFFKINKWNKSLVFLNETPEEPFFKNIYFSQVFCSLVEKWESIDIVLSVHKAEFLDINLVRKG